MQYCSLVLIPCVWGSLFSVGGGGGVILGIWLEIVKIILFWETNRLHPKSHTCLQNILNDTCACCFFGWIGESEQCRVQLLIDSVNPSTLMHILVSMNELTGPEM